MLFRHSSLHPSGHFEISSPDGPTIRGETMHCCHCSKHWNIVIGSGRDRGFCFKCNKVTCGAAACDPCVPIEKQLEALERPEDTRRLERPMPGRRGTERRRW